MTPADSPPRARRAGLESHSAVLHTCGSPGTPYLSSSVLHVVLGPPRPGQTPLSDLRDAGYEVVAVGVLSEEVPDCPEAGGYPRCVHVLIRRPKPSNGRFSP